MSKKIPPYKIIEVDTGAGDGSKMECAAIPLEEFGEYEPSAKKRRLWDRIASVFARGDKSNPDSEVDPEKTTATPTHAGGGIGTAGQQWSFRMDHTRAARYRDYERMHSEDTYLWLALEAFVGDIFSSLTGDSESFVVTSEDKAVQEIIDGVNERVNMADTMPQVVKAGMRMGDDFEELVFDDKNLLRWLKHLPPGQTRRRMDTFGRVDLEKAYEYTPPDSAATGVSGSEGITFPWWQVAHFCHAPERGNIYGTSFFYPCRRPFRILHPMEESIAIERLVNAGDRLVFYIPIPKGTPEAERDAIVKKVVQQYRRRVVLNSEGKVDLTKMPVGENVDLFLGVTEGEGATGRVERLPGSRAVGQLADVEYFQNMEIAGTFTPKSYLGLERDVNAKATLGWQDIHYARRVRKGQKEAATFMRFCYDRQLHLLKPGIKAEYYIEFPPISTIDEEARGSIQKMKWDIAAVARASFGAPVSWVLREIVGLEEDQIKTFMEDPDYKPMDPAGSVALPGARQPEPNREQTEQIRASIATNRSLVRNLTDLRSMLSVVASERLNQPVRY